MAYVGIWHRTYVAFILVLHTKFGAQNSKKSLLSSRKRFLTTALGEAYLSQGKTVQNALC